MTDAVVDDIVALLPPLMHTIEALAFVARHFHPTELPAVLDAIGRPEDALLAAKPRLQDWPDAVEHIRVPLEAASDAALTGIERLRSAQMELDGMGAARRGLRYGPVAQEALFGLAGRFPPISQFFVAAGSRQNTDLLTQLDQPTCDGETGLMHFGNDFGSRGGYSLFVPENYSSDRAWPLVVALHGGGGHGRAFLWSWLRDARAQGAILLAPTSVGGTWALNGEDVDTPNLRSMLAAVTSRWRIDPDRQLMTGMSDGGTFCYVSGFEADSPFTHLAPVSSSFHPMLAEFADADRLSGLPIFLTHGAQDWMFPVEIARRAERALSLAGASVTYREIDDLSHCYPTEINPEILDWLIAGQA